MYYLNHWHIASKQQGKIMKASAYEISATYGTNHTPCTVYVYDGWYVVEGSVNVNRTDDIDLVDGVDIEYLSDYDTFTASSTIESADDLYREVSS